MEMRMEGRGGGRQKGTKENDYYEEMNIACRVPKGGNGAIGKIEETSMELAGTKGVRRIEPIYDRHQI